MGMTEFSGRALEREQKRIGPRTAKAARIMLGWSVLDVSRHARIAPGRVKLVEKFPWVDMQVPAEREAVSAAFAAAGAFWCNSSTHEGAHCVYLKAGRVDDRRAILAALALMPVTVQSLAQRVEKRARIPSADLCAALAGRFPLSPVMVTECFRQLELAGCYFERAKGGGGWACVGCDSQGAWE